MCDNPCSQQQKPLPEHVRRVREITAGLEHDPSGKGCAHLGTDGVLRSFDAAGGVVDYRQLAPEQVREVYDVVFASSPAFGDAQKREMEERYRNAGDGREVPLEVVLDPGDEQRPPHLRKGVVKKEGAA